VITFAYTAKNLTSGEVVKAEVQAESEQAAAKLLITQSLVPITIEVKTDGKLSSKIGFLNRVSTKDRVIFTRQLATLINAGLPLTQSLRTGQRQLSNETLKAIVTGIINDVEGGSSLSNAFAKSPEVFNKIYISMVAAGESSGTLDKALERLAIQQEKDAAIVSKIRGALVYPVIVLVVILTVLIFMLTTVLPQIAQLYKDLKKTLPLLTLVMVAISEFIVHFWYLILIIVIGLGFALRAWSKTESGRLVIDRFKMDVFIFGALFRKVYMARFGRTFSTLLASGLPMLEALDIVKDAVGNVHVQNSLVRVMGDVKGGKSLSSSMEKDSNFLDLVPQMVGIGEQAGAIDDMLARVANFYEEEVDQEVKNLSSTIEPILMVVLGLVVALIVASILLPVYSLVGSGLN
jgi:type IV pilus assembly protein PilC